MASKSASHEVSQPDSQHTQHTAACEPSGKHYIRESAFCIALPATHIAVWTPEVTLVRYCSRCSDFSSLPKREKMLHNPASCMLTWYKHSLAGDSSASYCCQQQQQGATVRLHTAASLIIAADM